MLNYTDPTITKWEVDNLGNKVSVEVQNESKQIVGAKIVLEGMPDEYYRVQIEGFIEIDIKDKITNLNQFKVDYRKTGIVYFHPEIEAQTVVVERYYSKGLVYFPASRIWTKVDDQGEVIDTLDMSIDKIEFVNDSLVGYEDLISEANSVSSTLQSRTVTGQSLSTELSGKISAGSTLKTELSSATTAADTKKTELTNATTTANNTKTQLDTSITNAGTSKSNLDGSILTGDILKSDLDDRISTGNTLKNNLDDDIVAGNLLKVDLPPLIVSSTTAKNNLDGSIVTGDNLKDELDAIISGTDYEQVIIDVAALKTGKADKTEVANLLKGLTWSAFLA